MTESNVSKTSCVKTVRRLHLTINAFLPRGIRNNNPGNIRKSKTLWQGEITDKSKESEFAVFASPLMGLRALMRLLLTYEFKYGLDTIESLVNRYAPPSENATDHYINHVSRQTGIGRRHTVSLKDKKCLISIARAIVIHENGLPGSDFPDGWYLPKLYSDAADLALQNS